MLRLILTLLQPSDELLDSLPDLLRPTTLLLLFKVAHTDLNVPEPQTLSKLLRNQLSDLTLDSSDLLTISLLISSAN